MGKISRSPFKGKPAKGTGANSGGKPTNGNKTVIRNNTKNK